MNTSAHTGAGVATATLDTRGPVDPSFIGMEMHLAFALAPPWDFVSDPVVVEILP